MFNAMVLALLFGLQLVGAEAAKVQAPTLELVLAKDHLPGSFLTSESVYADRSFIFLASFQGQLFVLENSEPDFPLVAEIISPIGLKSLAVHGHGFRRPSRFPRSRFGQCAEIVPRFT
jgi:hypothetical protein